MPDRLYDLDGPGMICAFFENPRIETYPEVDRSMQIPAITYHLNIPKISFISCSGELKIISKCREDGLAPRSRINDS